MNTVSERDGAATTWQDRRSLVLLNVVGGLLVLGSYASVLAESPGVRAALWGGVPDALRPLYGVSMLLAAAGYMGFSWLLVVSLGRNDFEAATRASHGVLHLAYGLILIPSALWLPLTVRMIHAPDPARWAWIRIVLFAVAAGALAILWLTLRVARARPGTASLVAVLGAAALAFHTTVLDALVWPAYYPTQALGTP